MPFKRGLILCENEDGSEGGIWECAPAKFIREVMKAELTTILVGRCIFHHLVQCRLKVAVLSNLIDEMILALQALCTGYANIANK